MSVPAAEVAADFRDALQDLRMNSRPEISNLTLIAKENTEYAEAISTELENHIRSTRPEWKLPALYVLDSIVKNVGTPYTVYIGRNLYRTFMDAYLVMAQDTRKAMEGLLRTWKQPVPESMDPRPVFPNEVTMDIENALAKIRAAVQQQVQRPQHALPPRPPSNVAWRNTPTPPQNGTRYSVPKESRTRPTILPTAQHGLSMHTTTLPVPYQQPQPAAVSMSSVDLADLRTEVAQLIATTQSMFAHAPADVIIRTKLQALLSLKHILDTQTLPPQQLEAVRQQVRTLAPPTAVSTFAASTPAYPPQATAVPQRTQAFASAGSSIPSNTPSNIAQLLASFASPVQTLPLPAQVATPSTLNLADLLKHVSSPAQPPSISASATLQHQLQGLSSSIPPPAAAPQAALPAPSTPSTANLAALLAQFNQAAAPMSTPTPVQNTAVTPLPLQPASAAPAAGSTEWLLKALSGVSGASQPSTGPVASLSMARQCSAPISSMELVELSTASMKRPRLHLISRLYEAKPNLCATCGRRFDGSAEGKEKKARHMDWHFRVKDADAAKRGIHRSWYISEKEWIEYKEVDETSSLDPGGSADDAAHSGSAARRAWKQQQQQQQQQAQEQYVSVPQDASLQQAPCAICQEKFETVWSVEANDFVWMDAIHVGGKVYHATCFEEYSKGMGMEMAGTPDSILGKRKASQRVEVEGKKIKAY